MKKLFIIIALGAMSMSLLEAEKLTNFGTKTPEGATIESEKITVKNITDRPIFAAVYVLPKINSNEKEAQLFGDIYSIDSQKDEIMLRPAWTGLKFGKRALNDRIIFFSSNSANLKINLVPAELVRTNKQFIKIGNLEGDTFTISEDMLKNDTPVKKVVRTLTFRSPFPAKESDMSSKKDIIYYGFYKRLNDPKSIVDSLHAIQPDAKDSIAVELSPKEYGFVYFDTNRERLNSGNFINIPINLEKETENSFVIYPGILENEKDINSKFNPSLFGKRLRGMAQTEYDKTIKDEIE